VSKRARRERERGAGERASGGPDDDPLRFGGWDPAGGASGRQQPYPHSGPEVSFGPRYGFAGWAEESGGGPSRAEALDRPPRRFAGPGDPGANAEDAFDADYRAWRREQLRKLDEDYARWRHERRRRFADEFDAWRRGRSGGDDTKGR
jgi:hypothetical protein